MKSHNDNFMWEINLRLKLPSIPIARYQQELFHFRLLNTQWSDDQQLNIENLVKDNAQFILKVPTYHVDLWWPNGYGEQSLYYLEINYGTIKKSKRIGFRTIQLVQEPYPDPIK
ncbi:unnamed protein product, partial [Didymodactylos carnosus]